MKTFTFKIVFICANTDNQSTVVKEYKAVDYIQAKLGIMDYCISNKSFKSITSIKTL